MTDTRDPDKLQRAVAFLGGIDDLIDVAEANDDQNMTQDRFDVALLRALCRERLAEIERSTQSHGGQMTDTRDPALVALREEMRTAVMADPLADRWLPDLYQRTEAEIRKLIERTEELERRLDDSRAGAARFVQQIEELIFRAYLKRTEG